MSLDRADEFAEIRAVARQMEGFDRPWFVSGGWAIDLFLGRVTRKHADRELGVFRQDQLALQDFFAGRALFKVVEKSWAPWERHEWLALPIHQVMVRPAGSAAPVGDWESMPQEFEFFLNEGDDGMWQCRRNLSITRPADEIYFKCNLGIPILSPEIQLIFKAKHTRPKDEQDFDLAKDRLSTEQRAWLRQNLGIVHPDHRWIARL